LPGIGQTASVYCGTFNNESFFPGEAFFIPINESFKELSESFPSGLSFFILAQVMVVPVFQRT
jgi:hypothetical protein